MIEPEPIPRPDLFTNKDAEAWAEQFHMLAYVLRMTPEQIAQIDFGFAPEHPEAWAVFSWAGCIRREFPLVDARAMIRVAAEAWEPRDIDRRP